MMRNYVVLTGAFLSIGLMTNFLSLNEMLRISLQGKPILGVNLFRNKENSCSGREENLKNDDSTTTTTPELSQHQEPTSQQTIKLPLVNFQAIIQQ